MPRLARSIARDWYTGRINDKDLQQEVFNHDSSPAALRSRLANELKLLGAADNVIQKMRAVTGDPSL